MDITVSLFSLYYQNIQYIHLWKIVSFKSFLFLPLPEILSLRHSWAVGAKAEGKVGMQARRLK